MTTSTQLASSRVVSATAGKGRPPELDRFLESLRPATMGRRLSGALGLPRSSCHVLDAKYEPGLRAVMLYELGRRLVRGDLLLEAESAPGAAVIPPGLRICAFPDDPDLPTLARAVEPATMGPLLAEVVPGQTTARGRRAWAHRCALDLVRYRPGKRATVKATSRLHQSSYVAKVYHDSTKAAAVASEAWALRDAMTADGTLRFAPPVAYLPEVTVVVQQYVDGTPLDGLLSGGAGAAPVASAIRDVAQAMVELHGYPVVSERERSVTKELNRFVQRAHRVASVDAQLGGELLHLANRLLETDADLSPGPVGLVHGDCKPSQFLLGAQGVTVLDLDHCGISQQATDIGTFAASLRQLAIRSAVAGRTTDRRGLDGLARLFTETYLASRSVPGLRSRIRWHEAAALERKALRAFSRAPRSPLPAALAREGNRCLDQLSRGLT